MNHSFTVVDAVVPIFVAVVFVVLGSLVKEPARQRFMAVFVAGAGAAYLNGGLGYWEFVYAGIASYVAYRGLSSYSMIGIAWLMHTCWDVMHHVYGRPIIFSYASSSAGCAMTDALIAVWFLAGAPSVFFRNRKALT